MASDKTEIELADRNGDKFTCAVDSSVDGSSICLTNKVTNTRWMCTVNSINLTRYFTGEFELGRHHRIVMAILQAVYEGNIKKKRERQNSGNGGSLNLIQNHGIYCMELKLECWINSKNNCWVFPMTPEDPAVILKRQK